MDTLINIALPAIACVGLINLVISVLVIRCALYSPLQKLSQCAIVWFIPVLGAVGVWAFLRSQYNWRKYDTRAYPERSEKMDPADFGSGSSGGGGGD